MLNQTIEYIKKKKSLILRTFSFLYNKINNQIYNIIFSKMLNNKEVIIWQRAIKITE